MTFTFITFSSLSTKQIWNTVTLCQFPHSTHHIHTYLHISQNINNMMFSARVIKMKEEREPVFFFYKHILKVLLYHSLTIIARFCIKCSYKKKIYGILVWKFDDGALKYSGSSIVRDEWLECRNDCYTSPGL